MKDFWTIRNRIFFSVASVFQVTALILWSTDKTPSGFGDQSLWIAPVLMFMGIVLPVVGLLNITHNFSKIHKLKAFGSVGSVIIALITYVLTLEPTASLWDCGETIAAAYKLQVPHTPGIPFTLLLGRIFSMLSFGDVMQVAWWINFMAAFFSAMAIGIVFLIIWHYGAQFTHRRSLLFTGSLGGAMILTFSDTFWFSAVEAETYGPSCFFMVLLIYLSIQSNRLMGESKVSRWLLLAYVSGLSYCIHPMCILVLPVCFLIIWKDQFDQYWKYLLVSIGAGILAILVINKIIAVDLFEWSFGLDRWLVNQWSFPFYSGVIALLILLAILLIGLWYKLSISRVAIMALFFVMLGFTPYLMLFIRSAKLPPINEFSPHNLAMIKPYMNRESYPGRPLLYGPYFDARVSQISKKADVYTVLGDRYQKVGDIPQYHYEDHRMTILPRIYSDDPNHVRTYQEWTGLSPGEVPKFSDNLKFMFRYQLGHMYLRYLMWNFSGRVSDEQHAGWNAPWDGVADRSTIGYSRANNQYFLLPLLLGLVGAIWQSRKDQKGFLINLSFFLITGVLLVLYLNATPNEPRERDYIYVGSYMAFSAWIGLGLMVLGAKWRVVTYTLALAVPLWMLYQNLDDHNRSGRTFQIDHARNLLGSCEPDAILFTGGDNDTFPLWYLQEVEGFRTDVRVKVLSYFNADWYINQLTRTYYNSPPLKLTLSGQGDQYGPFNPLYIRETVDTAISWSKYMQALLSSSSQLQVKTSTGGEAYYLPSRKLRLATSQGMLDVEVKGSYLQKNEIAILDLIQSNDWKRPVYFNFTSLNSLGIQLQPYLRQQGLVYKLVPERSQNGDVLYDVEKSYHNLVTHSDYANLVNPNTYFNHEDFESRMILPLKITMNELIRNLLLNGEQEKASDVASFAHDHLCFDHLELSYADLQLAEFLKKGDPEKAEALVLRLFEYMYYRIKERLSRGISISRNEWAMLHGSARFLDDEKAWHRIEILKNMFE